MSTVKGFDAPFYLFLSGSYLIDFTNFFFVHRFYNVFAVAFL